MADYKDIVGTAVRSNDGELSGAKVGELFYDKTNANFDYKLVGAGSWATSNNLNTGRAALMGAGIQTAGLAFAGVPPSPAGNLTEEWNVPSNVVKTLTD